MLLFKSSHYVGKEMKLLGIRGTFLDFVDDPWSCLEEEKALRFYADGMLVLEEGKIKAFGSYEELIKEFVDIEITHIQERIILPGFIDGHIHMPQTRVLGVYGEQLLGWLHKGIFPEEKKYSDPEYAALGASHFFDNLLAAGTTTCQAFLTHSPVSVDAFFEEASKRKMLVLAGLTGIDRFAPSDSFISSDDFYEKSAKLIEKWHRKGRNLYAITPRFPLGSSHEMMQACQRLKKELPDLWVNSHLNENPEEIVETNRYHKVPDYLSVFEKYDLLGPKFSGGHSVWTSDSEYRRLHQAGAAVCFCPLSNLFLGSGFFRLGKVTDPDYRIRFAMGSDVGAGDKFSILCALNEGYKVGMCNYSMLTNPFEQHSIDHKEAERNRFSSCRAFYAATLGGAKALYLDDRIGNFAIGKEADFVVLDWKAGQRACVWQTSQIVDAKAPQTIQEALDLLFSIMILGDDRNVAQTWILGELAYLRS